MVKHKKTKGMLQENSWLNESTTMDPPEVRASPPPLRFCDICRTYNDKVAVTMCAKCEKQGCTDCVNDNVIADYLNGGTPDECEDCAYEETIDPGDINIDEEPNIVEGVAAKEIEEPSIPRSSPLDIVTEQASELLATIEKVKADLVKHQGAEEERLQKELEKLDKSFNNLRFEHQDSQEGEKILTQSNADLAASLKQAQETVEALKETIVELSQSLLKAHKEIKTLRANQETSLN